MKYTLILFILLCTYACTIGTSHKVIINQYGDSDTTKGNVTIINYTDSIKHKKQIKK